MVTPAPPDLHLIVESVRWEPFSRALWASGLPVRRIARDVPEPGYVTVELGRPYSG